MPEFDTHSPEDRFRSPFQVIIDQPQRWYSLALKTVSAARKNSIVLHTQQDSKVLQEWTETLSGIHSALIEGFIFQFAVGLRANVPHAAILANIILKEENRTDWDAETCAFILAGQTSLKISIREFPEENYAQITTQRLKNGNKVIWVLSKNQQNMLVGWEQFIDLTNTSNTSFYQQMLLSQKMLNLVISTVHLAADQPIPTGKWQIRLPKSHD